MDVWIFGSTDRTQHRFLARSQIRYGIASCPARSPEKSKLPSTRLLSKELGVNRITVTQAYRILISEGLLESGVGSGTFVAFQGPKSRFGPDPATQDNRNQLDRSIFTPQLSLGTRALWHAGLEAPAFRPSGKDAIDFASLVPDRNTFPMKPFRRCLDRVMDQHGARLLEYGGSLGFLPLRKHLAERMAKQGIETDPDRILLVSGAQQGIDLVLRSFLSPGDRLALGYPTYHHVYPIAEQLQAGVATFRLTDEGPDPESLEETLKDRRVRLLYTMPNFQNPLGVTTPADRRRTVYELARAADIPILEDDFERDLDVGGESIPPIRALDRDGRVLYLSTFSKSLFPGLRIGWIVASRPVIEALTALKKATDLEGSALLQAAAWAFCTEGHYDRHLETIRALIGERMDAAAGALKEMMPEGVSWTRPRGGYVLWVRLPTGVSSERVFREGLKEGVHVSPGTLFSRGRGDPGGVRLSLTLTDASSIRTGIRRLARVIDRLSEAARARARAPAQPGQHL